MLKFLYSFITQEVKREPIAMPVTSLKHLIEVLLPTWPILVEWFKALNDLCVLFHLCRK